MRCVAFIRGINVGRARRVSMADLRRIVEDLGCAEVRTFLNSGNVIFDAPATTARAAASRIEASIEKQVGIAVRVIVLSASQLASVVRENPLARYATDPSRLLVTILMDRNDRRPLQALTRRDWSPEMIAVGTHAAYLWCPGGITESDVNDAVNEIVEGRATARNWTTVVKLDRLLRRGDD